MKVLFKENQIEFNDLLPIIGDDFNFWYVVSISLERECVLTCDEIVAEMVDVCCDVQGVVYSKGNYRVLGLANLVGFNSVKVFKKKLVDKISNENLFISVQQLTQRKLRNLQVNYLRPEDDLGNLFEQRNIRNMNKILVVDDNPMVRLTMRKIIAAEYDVIDVADSSSVSSVYREYNPDVLFLDIHMPGKSGLEVMQEIFECDENAYVVMISADRDSSNVIDAVKKGAAGYIAKPIRKNKVFSYIKKCVTISDEAK